MIFVRELFRMLMPFKALVVSQNDSIVDMLYFNRKNQSNPITTIQPLADMIANMSTVKDDVTLYPYHLKLWQVHNLLSNVLITLRSRLATWLSSNCLHLWFGAGLCRSHWPSVKLGCLKLGYLGRLPAPMNRKN